MPKEKTALTHPATLKSLCPPVTCTFGPLLAIDLSESSWFSGLSTAGVPFLYWEGVIDLGAFVLDDLTWVTTEKDIQEPGNFELNYTTPQRMEFIEFVSNTPLNRDRLTEVADDWQVNDAVPGMMGSTLNFENIINGRWRQFTPETTLPGGSAMELKGSSFGSCEPSASERLYTYCMVKFDDVSGIAPTDTVVIPGRRFLLGGAAIQEPDLEYIMRLRRSYILQQ